MRSISSPSLGLLLVPGTAGAAVGLVSGVGTVNGRTQAAGSAKYRGLTIGALGWDSTNLLFFISFNRAGTTPLQNFFKDVNVDGKTFNALSATSFFYSGFGTSVTWQWNQGTNPFLANPSKIKLT